MRCDEYIDGIQPLDTMEMVRRKIGRGQALHVQDMISNPDAVKKGSVYKPKMLTGQYVPDEEHAHICLNCKKKTCTGYCRQVKSRKEKHKKKEGPKT